VSKALFLDRDGTLLVEVGYVNHPSVVTPYNFAGEALRRARAHGYLTVVITNQSGIARGYLTEEELAGIHERMHRLLEPYGAALDAVYYCPHYPGARVEAYRKTCSCRKPGTDLGLQAVERFGIDVTSSYMIGDKETDLLFGKALGVTPCLVRTGFGSYEEQRLGSVGIQDSMVFDNLLAAVDRITSGDGKLQ
jgi:D-glycero-D-manno-heptose 1,7-bisphosphate phosphatase